MTQTAVSPGLWALVDLNLVEATREFGRCQSGGSVIEEDGLLIVAGSTEFPAGPSNCALRTDPEVPADDIVRRALECFGDLQRGFSLYIRGEQDADLAEAATRHGLTPFSDQPWMVCDRKLDEPRLPEDVSLCLVTDEEGLRDALAVNREAFESIGLPPEETDALFGEPRRLLSGRCTTYVAYIDGRPVSTAMLIFTEGVAGVYWVGTVNDSRRRGLGEACTRVATNIGFERGAKIATLQASRMGESIYARLGYRTVDRLRWFLHTVTALAGCLPVMS